MSWPLKTTLSIDQSKAGRTGYSLPNDLPSTSFKPAKMKLRAKKLNFPEMSELQVVRHFTRLSQLNYSIDGGMYPLGSCTMKYNPRINEHTASNPDFAHLHPLTPPHLVQGALELMYKLENELAEISGFARVSLQPAAGAQGEYTGIRMIRAYLDSKNNPRRKILIPESAHGTNPATAAMCGFEVVQIKTAPDGRLDLKLVEELVAKDDIAGIMLTNPNTVGLFEKDIEKICAMIHEHGGLVYCDGANLNAMLGITRPGDAGVDVMHFNMHKTFTTPHGGGGPGCGGVGVSKTLVPFLPTPTIERDPRNPELFTLKHDQPQSIGKIKSFYGHFLMMVRAYTYIRELGAEGIRQVGTDAILLANYVRERLKPYYDIAYDSACMHEVIFNDKRQNKNGIKTLDIAKRLIDLGYHPPTVYFPLLVPGAIMIEPTETESLETVEDFCKTMIQIAEEVENPALREKLFNSNTPESTPYGRINEVKAVKDLILTWKDLKSE